MGEVLSHAQGYNNLANLLGALAFHTVFMVAGGLFFVKGVEKAPAEKQAAGARG